MPLQPRSAESVVRALATVLALPELPELLHRQHRMVLLQLPAHHAKSRQGGLRAPHQARAVVPQRGTIRQRACQQGDAAR